MPTKKKDSRGALVPVLPQRGSIVLVYDHDDPSKPFIGEVDPEAAKHAQADGWFMNRCKGTVPVVYGQRYAFLAIEPAWEIPWHREIDVRYRQRWPQPLEGDTVYPRNCDSVSTRWSVYMALLPVRKCVPAGAPYDAHWFAVLSREVAGRTEFLRAWIRFTHSGQAFIPVQDPWVIGKLNKELHSALGREAEPAQQLPEAGSMLLGN